MTTAALPAYQFTYDSAGAGELAGVLFPYGGKLAWVYDTFTYSSNRLLREVQKRNLQADSSHSSTAWSYGLSRPDAANSVTQHTAMTLTDASGVGVKTWNFNSSGQVSSFVQAASAGGTVYTTDTYTWTTDPAGNPYISAKVSVTDPNGSNPQSAKTTQTLDQYGNTTQSVVYPYNNTSTPLNTYNNTYLTDATYMGYYIRNRLLSTTLTNASGTTTLAQNYYDGKYSSFGEPARPAWAQTTCNGSWGQPNPGSGATLLDATPPVPFLYRGLTATSVNPATTYCMQYDGLGVVQHTLGSDGTNSTSTANSSTNYTAPSSISTQSYGESITYNSWLGATSVTGLNGEQLSMTYD